MLNGAGLEGIATLRARGGDRNGTPREQLTG